MPMGIGIGIGVVKSEGMVVPAWARGSDLWRDFVYSGAGNLGDPTDTHAQTIYAPNAAGIYAPFSANVLTRTDLGLQTVPTRTELSAAPIPKTATWTKINITITDNALAAPDGTLTAANIVRTNTAASYTYPDAITKAASAIQYTQAVIAKADTAAFLAMRLQGLYPARADVCFNLSTGAISSAAVTAGAFASASASITALGNGWYLCVLTATSDTHTNLLAYISPRTSTGQIDAVDASGAAGLYVWSNNVQAAAFAVPPILTGSATVNGNQQVVSGLGTQLAVGVAGIVQVQDLQLGTATVERFLEIDDGSSNNRLLLAQNATQIVLIATSGGVAQATLSDAYVPGVGTTVTIAFALGTNYANFRVVARADPGADTTVTYPVMDRVVLGGRGVDTVSNNYQFTKKLALKFGAQDANTFAAMYQRAVLAAAA